MADPGKIALMLELQLAAEPALKTLESIETKFANIEKMAANIAKSMTGGAAIPTPSMTPPSVTPPQQSASAAASPAIDATTPADLMTEAKFIELLGLRADRINQIASDLSLLNNLENAEKDLILDMIKFSRDLNADDIKRLNLTQQQVKALQQLQSVEEELNDDRAGWRTTFLGLWNTMSGKLGEAGNAVDEIITGVIRRYTPLIILLGVANRLLKTIIDEQDEFAKANYRAAGSMTDLQMEMREFQFATAASAESARKAGTAIYQAGIRGYDAHSILVPEVIRLSAAFGVSEATAANYAARLSAMGMSATGVTENMNFTAKAITAAGLSAAEADQLFAELEKRMWGIYAITGNMVKAQAFGKIFAGMTALARDAKVPLADIQQLIGDIGRGSMNFYQLGITSKKALNDPLGATAIALDKIPQRLELIQRAMDKGMPIEAAEEMMQALTGTTLEGGQAAKELLKTLQSYEGATTAEKLDSYLKHIDSQKSITESYKDVLETLSGIVQQTLVPAFNILMSALVPIAQIFGFLLTPVVTIIKAFTEIAALINRMVGINVTPYLWGIAAAIVAINMGMGPWLAVLTAVALVFKGLKAMIESNILPIKILGIVLTALSTAFLLAALRSSVFAKSLLSLTPVGKIFGKFGETTSKVFGKIGDAFGKTEKIKAPAGGGEGIKGFLTSLAEGLKAFGKNSMQILKGALTFAVAMTLMAAPVLLLAWAAKELGIGAAEMGIAIAAMVAVALVMGLVGPIMAAGAAAISAAAIPILIASLVIAAAIVILGAGIAIAIGLIMGAIEAGKGIGKGIGKMAEGAGDAIGGAFEAMGDTLRGAGRGLGNLVESVFGSLGKAIGTSFEAIGDGFADLLGQSEADKMEDMGEAMQEWAEAISKAPNLSSDIKTISTSLVELNGALNDGGGKLISAFEAMAVSLQKISEIDSAELGGVAQSISALADATSRIVAPPDLAQLLAGNVIGREADFVTAAGIVSDYADSVSEDLARITGLAEALKQAESLNEASEALAPSLAKVSPVAESKKATPRLSASAAREKTLEELERQTKLLEKLLSGIQNNASAQALAAILNKMDELIDVQEKGVNTHPATQW